MKTWKRFCGTLALCTLLLPMVSSTCHAQEKAASPSAVATERPTVVVGINSIDKLVPDLMYFMRATGQQAYGGFITLFANSYGQGLDKARPIGLTASITDSPQPITYLMLPISNIDTFFAANAQYLTFDELSDGKYSLTVGPSNVYGSLQNNWLYVTQFEEDLKAVPSNPQALLEPLVARYDIGINLNAQSIPQELKDQFVSSMQQGFESAMARQAEGKSAEEVEAARKSGQATMDEFKQLVTNTEQLLIGMNIDQSEKVVQLDFGTKFQEGSDLANQIALQKDLTTKFAGVTKPTDPIQLRYRSKLDEKSIESTKRAMDAQLEQLDSQLKSSVDDAKAREIIRSFVTAIINALKATMAEGELDGAYAINFTNGLNLVALGQIASPDKLEAEVIALIKNHQSENGAPKLSGDRSDYKGLSFYQGSWDLPQDADFDGLRKATGDALPFALAFGNNQGGFAFGKDAAANLKLAVDQASASPAPSTPMDLTIDVLPLLQYVDAFIDDPRANSILQATIAKVTENAEKDTLRVESRAMNNGVVVRLTLEEGVLRAIGTAATASAAPPRR